MAKTEKRARERTVSSSYFLGCFGLSRKIYSDKAKVAAEVGCEMKKKKKRSRWLLCSKFRSKNREIKPAPIEKTEITTPSVEDETDKKKPVSLISRITTDRTHVLADDKAVNQETKEVSLSVQSQKTFNLLYCVGKLFSDNLVYFLTNMIFSFSLISKKVKQICGSSDVTINRLLNFWKFISCYLLFVVYSFRQNRRSYET